MNDYWKAANRIFLHHPAYPSYAVTNALIATQFEKHNSESTTPVVFPLLYSENEQREEKLRLTREETILIFLLRSVQMII